MLKAENIFPTLAIQGELGGVLDLLHADIGLNIADPGYVGQRIHAELPEVLQVTSDDAQSVVPIASQLMTLKHVRKICYLFFEPVSCVLSLTIETNLHDCLQFTPNRCRVQ